MRKLSGLNTFQAWKKDGILQIIDQIKGYCCESDMHLFIWMFTWKYNNSPFQLIALNIN